MTTPDHAGIRARLAAAAEALSPEAAEVVSIPIPLREASALLAENQRLRDTIQAATTLAQMNATAAHALGTSRYERDWLDLLVVLERAEALGVSGE